MRFSWDPQKDELLRQNRKRGNIGFADVLVLYKSPYYETLRNDDPEQFVSIGWVGLSLYTLIFEEREDETGPYRHLITFWKSSTQEQQLYAKHSR